jgi:hypothetical protein
MALVVPSGWAQNRPQVALETSETLFTVLTAINTCGYDQELSASDPLRTEIRSEVAHAVENIAGAQDVIAPMCAFYRRRQIGDASRELSQFVSLALYLEEPPTFRLKVKEAELPPDAEGVADMAPLIEDFYEKLGVHAIWERDRDLSRSAGEDDVRHRDLSEAAIGGLPGTPVHRLSGCDGRAGPDQRAQLCIGLLRRHFTDSEHGDQDAADSAYVSALSSGSAGVQVRRLVQAD